jgi:hypothetical protein
MVPITPLESGAFVKDLILLGLFDIGKGVGFRSGG